MKLSITPLASAIGLVLVSMSAHSAALSPIGQTLTSSPTSTGLYVALYDSAGNNSEIVNLGQDISQTSFASGNLTPTSAVSPFALTTAPGGGGQVYQLDFGTLSGFTGGSPLFNGTNAATTQFMVFAGITGAAGVEEFQATSASTPVIAYSAVNGAILNIQSEIANWAAAAPTNGDLKDTTGTQPYSVKTGPLNGGQIVTNQFYSGGLNTAVNFWDITTTAAHQALHNAYSNGTGQGYFYLSSSGDLTYNIAAAAAVPLPAAVWLLGSGLLGMAGVARRRRTAV